MDTVKNAKQIMKLTEMEVAYFATVLWETFTYLHSHVLSTNTLIPHCAHLPKRLFQNAEDFNSSITITPVHNAIPGI